ncbi:MAG TPA: hypothetical protein VGS10_19070, partial [Terracidiphilus sp.]|nr:hypothetical protein [Terracidiphilus sp.]
LESLESKLPECALELFYAGETCSMGTPGAARGAGVWNHMTPGISLPSRLKTFNRTWYLIDEFPL